MKTKEIRSHLRTSLEDWNRTDRMFINSFESRKCQRFERDFSNSDKSHH